MKKELPTSKHSKGPACRQAGFTLIEILIVVSIVALLGVTAIIGINPLTQIFKGYDTRRKMDLNIIKVALENYYSDHDCYPEFPPSEEMEGRFGYVCDSNILAPYLNAMPCDPSTKKPYLIHLLPEDSTCPQQYAVYASTISPFDTQANNISKCPQTLAIKSPDMRNIDLGEGCSGIQASCYTHYGCRNGACVIISEDVDPPCSPSYCDSLCNPITDRETGEVIMDCTTGDGNGGYVRECL